VIDFAARGDTSVAFTPTPKTNPVLGTFSVTKYKAGVVDATGGVKIPTGITFHIEYQLTSPVTAKRTIRGTIDPTSAASDPLVFKFLTQVYTLSGSWVELCTVNNSPRPNDTTNNKCDDVSLALNSGGSQILKADVGPTEPQRLVVTSTGFGPVGAVKQLQGVLQKNFLDDLASTSAISLVGPATGMRFDAGTGAPT
jgi:hypothetical protein